MVDAGMDEKEFKALVTLLDDSDPEVSDHVWNKLSGLGEDVLKRLESEWENRNDPSIQSRIEELIQRIHTSNLTSQIFDWRKKGGMDLLAGWILLSKVKYPGLDEDHIRNEVNRLVNKAWLETSTGLDSVGKLRVLNNLLFTIENFKPDRKSPRSHNNFHVNHLIDSKKGNPHSLGLLYLIICQKLEFPVGGVILPGYFLLFFKEGNKEFFIDIFNGGLFFTREDLKRHLKTFGLEEKPSFFKPTSNIYMILEIIHCLIDSYRNEGNEDKAEEMEDLLKDIEIKF